MPFITKTDLTQYIETVELDEITNSTDSRLDRPIADALAIIRGELSHRYDIDAIFAAPSNEDYAVIKKIGVDIALYHIYQLVQSRHIPEFRIEQYDKAIMSLHRIAISDFVNSLPLLPKENGDTNSGQGAAYFDDFIETRY